MPSIFISYRREDNSDAAGRIYDRLAHHFGSDSVFFDIDAIPFGVDFRSHIDAFVAKCDVVLVVIGDNWLCKDETGQPRLENPADFVRLEVESALERNIPVIPVLVGNAQTPQASDLPASIRELAFRNSAEARAGSSFQGQLDRLIRGIEYGQAQLDLPSAKTDGSSGSPTRQPVGDQIVDDTNTIAERFANATQSDVGPDTSRLQELPEHHPIIFALLAGISVLFLLFLIAVQFLGGVERFVIQGLNVLYFGLVLVVFVVALPRLRQRRMTLAGGVIVLAAGMLLSTFLFDGSKVSYDEIAGWWGAATIVILAISVFLLRRK